MEETSGLSEIVAITSSVIFGIIFLALAVVMTVANWKIFEKAGKPGWAVLVPVYNSIVLLEIIGKPVWWIILFIIPIVNLYAAVVTTILLAKSFGKDVGYGIGLLLAGIIFYPMLAFGDAKYHGPAGLEKI